MFNRKIIFNPGPFSSAMLVYENVYSIAMQDFPEGWLWNIQQWELPRISPIYQEVTYCTWRGNRVVYPHFPNIYKRRSQRVEETAGKWLRSRHEQTLSWKSKTVKRLGASLDFLSVHVLSKKLSEIELALFVWSQSVHGTVWWLRSNNYILFNLCGTLGCGKDSQ